MALAMQTDKMSTIERFMLAAGNGHTMFNYVKRAYSLHFHRINSIFVMGFTVSLLHTSISITDLGTREFITMVCISHLWRRFLPFPHSFFASISAQQYYGVALLAKITYPNQTSTSKKHQGDPQLRYRNL